MPLTNGYRAIDVFVHYDGKRATDIPPSKYSLRQLVASTVRSSSFALLYKAEDDNFCR